MATLFDEKDWPALGSEVLGRRGGFRGVKSKTRGEVFCWGLVVLGEVVEKKGREGEKKVREGEKKVREGEKKGREGEKKGREGEKKGREGEKEGEGKNEEKWGVVRRKVEKWGVVRRKEVGGGGSVPADGEDVPADRGDVPADADRADAGYDCDSSTSCISRLSIYVCLSNHN